MPRSIAGGALQGLESILAEQFMKAQEAQRIKEAEAEMALRQRQVSNQESQFGQEFGLRREQFGEDKTNSEFNRNITAANLALKGTEMGRQFGLDEQNQNQQLFENAMRGTTMANQNEQAALDRNFTASQNAADRSLTREGMAARAAASGPTPQGAPSPYTAERVSRTVETIDSLLPQIGHSTAGAGAALANIPVVGGMTDAGAVKSKLATLAANIAFNELAQMREASKTGGALGNVSERELDLLSNSLGAIQQNQHPDTLRSELENIKASLQRWQQAVAAQGATGGAGGVSLGAAQAGMGGGGGRVVYDENGRPVRQ